MTYAVILAGGRGSRLGGCDKPLLPLGQGALLDTILERLTPQVSTIALAIRGDQTGYARFGLPVLRDGWVDQGPLIGILSALEWGRGEGASEVLTVSGDTPFIPRDLVSRLSPGPSCAMSRERSHPLIALWPTTCLSLLRDHLARALASGARRQLAVRRFTEKIAMRDVSFDDEPDDPFFNINTPEDVDALALRSSRRS